MAFFRSGGVRSRARLWAVAVVGVVLILAAGVGGVAFHNAFLQDLPDFESVTDYQPPLTSLVRDGEGRLIGEFFTERRQLVPIERIPKHVQLAFVAAEDSTFFEHSGIDYVSILRAAWVDLTAGEIVQGASTITMQLVKQMLLSPEKRFRRKIREMILARRLESQLSKEDILYLYLNQIYFGYGAYGIGEAAFTYFDKPVEALSVAEAAMLAGLPQRPSAYSPFRNPELASSRRSYVLRRMLDDEVIDRAQYDEAMATDLGLRPPAAREDFPLSAYFVEEVRRYLFDRLGGDVVLNGGLQIETTLDLDLQRSAVESLQKGLTDHDRRQGYRGPLRQVKAGEIDEEIGRLAVENELLPEPAEEDEAGSALASADGATTGSATSEGAGNEAATAEGAGQIATADAAALDESEASDEEAIDDSPLPLDTPVLGVVTAVDTKAKTATVAFAPEIVGVVNLKDVSWAREPDPKRRPRAVRKIDSIFRVGDVASFVRIPDEDEDAAAEEADAEAEASPEPMRVDLVQEPIVEGALLSIEVATGDVIALVGGYDYGRSQFNRVTQAQRQPGSAFKPFIYGAALSRGYTPVATLYDRPVVYKDPVSGFVWRPQNYSRAFYGPMPMRTALARSVNNATVHLFRDVGVDFVIDYARRLGIQAELSRDLSLALGSSDVTLLELTTAYATYPNGGRRVTPRFIARVTDRDGNVLLEDVPLGTPPPPVLKPLVAEGEEEPEPLYPDGEIVPTDQLISEAAAYLMCDLLKAVVFDRDGTGWRLKDLRRPVGGKTGTTNDQFDAWFMGFSPEIATGVWVGHDESRFLGIGETGSRAAAPIWVGYMRDALAGRRVRDFEVPERIVFQRVDRATGLLADSDSSDTYFQAFLEGTEPTRTASTDRSDTDTRRALREDAF